MSATRRGFLGWLSAVVASPSAALAKNKYSRSGLTFLRFATKAEYEMLHQPASTIEGRVTYVNSAYPAKYTIRS